jgi:hypothetical protein
MPSRIQRLLSAPIKPAMMLAVAVRLELALIISPSNGRETGGIGMPFLHPASMIAIPYLAQLQCGRKSQ